MKQVMFILTVLAISTGCESAVSDAPSQVYWWPQPSSVVVCVIQSQSYSAVFSDPLQTPFMNSLLQQGASFSNAYAQNQGPIGSMMRLFAGTLAGMGTTPAFQSIPIEPFNLPNLAAKLEERGMNFAGYSEGLPEVGYAGKTDTGINPHIFSPSRTPWSRAWFSNANASANRPFSEFAAMAERRDFSELPEVAFVVPDLCNSGYLCPVSTVDRWLAEQLSSYVAWARANNGLFVLTSTDDGGCVGCSKRVPLVMVGQMVPKALQVDAPRVDHTMLAKQLGDMYGVLAYTFQTVSAPPFPDVWLPPPIPVPLGCVIEDQSLLPRPDHVVVVVLENHDYEVIRTSPLCDWLNSLATQGTVFAHSHALQHPSQPNYLHLFAGDNLGVLDDRYLRFDYVDWPSSLPNMGSAFLDAGLSFAGFSEGLPSAGWQGSSSGSFPHTYHRKHAPWTNFANIPVSAQLPFSAFPSSDFASLPTLSWVVPDQCNDQHDCSYLEGALNISIADDWLALHIQPYVDWAMTHNSLLIVTYDEDGSAGNNHILTAFAGQSVKAGHLVDTTITHHSLLRLLLDMYQLPHFHPRVQHVCPFPTSWVAT